MEKSKSCRVNAKIQSLAHPRIIYEENSHFAINSPFGGLIDPLTDRKHSSSSIDTLHSRTNIEFIIFRTKIPLYRLLRTTNLTWPSPTVIINPSSSPPPPPPYDQSSVINVPSQFHCSIYFQAQDLQLNREKGVPPDKLLSST